MGDHRAPITGPTGLDPGGDAGGSVPHVPEPMPRLRLGERIAGIPPLTASDGRTYDLGSFAASEVLVMAFLGDACPAVKALAPCLAEFQTRFASKGVQVIGINSNNQYLSPRDSPNEMTLWAAEWQLNFPYLKDASGGTANAVGATNTPHFLVFDRDRRLRYRGRMFDSREPARASRRDLETAVEGLLAGRPVEEPETSPLGCSIVW